MPRKKGPPKWRGSNARELLLEDIKNNIVSDDIEAELVYGMRLEYQVFELTKFKTNLKNLLIFAAKCRARAEDDRAAVDHDALLQTIHDPNRWHGSDAERLLDEDIKAHMFVEGASPMDCWLSRPEYQQFHLEKFRSHLYQGRRAKTSGYWMKKKAATTKGIKLEKEKEIVISEM
jgi:hypothetical protein